MAKPGKDSKGKQLLNVPNTEEGRLFLKQLKQFKNPNTDYSLQSRGRGSRKGGKGVQTHISLKNSEWIAVYLTNKEKDLQRKWLLYQDDLKYRRHQQEKEDLQQRIEDLRQRLQDHRSNMEQQGQYIHELEHAVDESARIIRLNKEENKKSLTLVSILFFVLISSFLFLLAIC